MRRIPILVLKFCLSMCDVHLQYRLLQGAVQVSSVSLCFRKGRCKTRYALLLKVYIAAENKKWKAMEFRDHSQFGVWILHGFRHGILRVGTENDSI